MKFLLLIVKSAGEKRKGKYVEPASLQAKKKKMEWWYESLLRDRKRNKTKQKYFPMMKKSGVFRCAENQRVRRTCQLKSKFVSFVFFEENSFDSEQRKEKRYDNLRFARFFLPFSLRKNSG